MAKAVTVYARMSGGKMIPENNYDWDRMGKVFEGKRVTVRVSIPEKIRSNPQNSYLWGVVYSILAKETGNDPQDLHEYFKDRFLRLPPEPGDDGGWRVPRTKSTTKLLTMEFIEYYRKIIEFAATDLGVFVPEPNEEEMWQLMQMIEAEEKKGRKR